MTWPHIGKANQQHCKTSIGFDVEPLRQEKDTKTKTHDDATLRHTSIILFYFVSRSLSLELSVSLGYPIIRAFEIYR